MEKKSAETDFVTTEEAADSLGVSVRRIQMLLNDGVIAGAMKIGRDWIIPRSSLAGVKTYGKAGRPKGAKNKPKKDKK